MNLLDPKKVGWIVWHTAAAAHNGLPVDQSARTIRNYHVNTKGWSDIGYHYVIRFNGDIEAGRPLKYAGAHVEGLNERSLGICFSGHGDFANLTPEQRSSGIDLTMSLLKKYGLLKVFKENPLRVLGHCEVNLLIPDVLDAKYRTTKSCPGTLVKMSGYRKTLLAQARAIKVS
jgi:N-acetylmuramoyl-L-alanine amidase